MEQQVKLSKFEKAVFAEVEAKVGEIHRQAEADKESTLRQSETDLRLQAEEAVQKQTQDIRRKSKREVAKFGLDAKRSVLKKRGEITDSIFAAVSRKLEEFRAAPDYEAYLLSRVAAFAQANPLANVRLLLAPADLPLAPKVREAYGLPCEVLASASVRLGGFIVRDAADSVYFDESLGQKLEDQKSYFIEHSQLDL